MKITKLETIIFQLPGRSSYTWRSLQIPIGRYVILKMETDEGITGLGEAPAILSWGGEHGRYFGEDPEIVCHVVDAYLAPILMGADPFSVKTILARMDEDVRGFPYTKAMVESALLDIVGRALGVPVYQLLGAPPARRFPSVTVLAWRRRKRPPRKRLRCSKTAFARCRSRFPENPSATWRL